MIIFLAIIGTSLYIPIAVIIELTKNYQYPAYLAGFSFCPRQQITPGAFSMPKKPHIAYFAFKRPSTAF